MKIPGYTIIRQIGAGGMAVVYLATQDALEREVALKVLRKSGKDDPEVAVRFLNEARTIAKLEHASIVGIFDVGQTVDGKLYYCMPNLANGDLLDFNYETDEPLQSVLQQVCEGLAYAHEHGIIHRDIKPENILFDHQGNAQIADFGIAFTTRSTNTRLTKEGHTVGSANHMSPEQAHGDPVDARSDLYSLGIVLYEVLVGDPPFDGADDVAILVSQVSDPVPRLPSELSHWQTIIDRALSKSPADRYQTAAEMGAAIAALEPTRIQPASWQRLLPARLLRFDRRDWFWSVVGLSSVALALVLMLVMSWGDAGLQSDDPEFSQPIDPGKLMDAEEFDQLLRAAYQRIADGNWVQPDQASALDGFLQVLDFDPNSAEALAGMQSIIEHFDEELIAAIEQQDYSALRDALSGLGKVAQDANLEQDPRIIGIRFRLISEVADLLRLALQRLDHSAAESLIAIGMSLDPRHPAYQEARQQLQALPTRGQLLEDGDGVSSVFVPSVTQRLDGQQRRMNHGFAMAIHEVSRSLYQQFAEDTGRGHGKCKKPGDPVALFRKTSWQAPGFAQTATDPVVCVSWHDASRFAQWLSQRSGHQYRLPSQQEWLQAAWVGQDPESACAAQNLAGSGQNAGVPTGTSCGDRSLQTAPIGSFQPNRLGVFDLAGNVSEWTVTCAPDTTAVGKVLDKLRLADKHRCDRRTMMGLSWRDQPSPSAWDHLGYVKQDQGLTTLGIRLVRDLGAERADSAG